MSTRNGFVLPFAMLLALLISTLLAGALAVAALEGKLAGGAAARLKDAAAAEGAVWLGISLVARDLIADPRADGNFSIAGPLPASVGAAQVRPDLPQGSMPVASPLLPPDTTLWVAPRPPGRWLATAHAARGSGVVRRTGHIEYLETTPLSFSLILDASQAEITPALSVTGRAAILRGDGRTTTFSRLDLALPPPVPGPEVSWPAPPGPGELVAFGGGVRLLEGSLPTGRLVAMGEALPPRPFDFPDSWPAPIRQVAIRGHAPLPPAPLPRATAGDSTVIGRCGEIGVEVGAGPPYAARSAAGFIEWDGVGRLAVSGIVHVEGDLDLPAGLVYAGTGILAVDGDVVIRGDLLPDHGFPAEDALTIVAAGEVSLRPEGGDGGRLHAIISSSAVDVRGRWTIFGALYTGGIEGPAEASLAISPPPRGDIPLQGTPLWAPPCWLLLEAGCRDPDVRWP